MQIIHIFRRVLPRVAPYSLDSAVAVPQGSLLSWLTNFQHSGAPNLHDLIASSAEQRKGRGSVVSFLLLAYASAATLQVRGRAEKRPVHMSVPGSVGGSGAVCAEVAPQLRALLQSLFSGDALPAGSNDAVRGDSVRSIPHIFWDNRTICLRVATICYSDLAASFVM